MVYLTAGGKYLYMDYRSGTSGTDDFFRFEGDQIGLLFALGFRF